MTEAQRTPAECFHPSEFIKDELDARGWTLDHLATLMTPADFGREEWGLNRLTLDFYFEIGPSDTNLRIGEVTASRLAAAFDVSPDYFINLEKSWLAWTETPAGRAALANAPEAQA